MSQEDSNMLEQVERRATKPITKDLKGMSPNHTEEAKIEAGSNRMF